MLSISFYSSVFFLSLFRGSNSNKLIIYGGTGDNFTKFEEIVNGTLELTCKLINNKNVSLPVHLNWLVPQYTKSRPNVTYTSDHSLKLTITHLHESDSGEYVCKGKVNDTEYILQEKVSLHVKQKQCAGFRCNPNLCIISRFVCDGHKDCESGIDESVSQCGGDPCLNKIPCVSGDITRCIPRSWCCLPMEPNCTHPNRPSCCPPLPSDGEPYPPHGVPINNHYNQMSFLQSTIYTIVGFAMVFMSIVTILMIAICRVHLQRSLLSSIPRRPTHASNDQFYSRRTQRNCENACLPVDRMTPGLLVSYNMGEGLQLVGEPPQPPPYSQVVMYDDPPPPYVPILNRDEDSETSPCLCNEKAITS